MTKLESVHSDSLLERLVEFVERERFTVLTAVLYLLLIGAVRSLSESYMGEYLSFGIPLFTQHITFYFSVFFAGAVVISVLADIDIKKVVNVQLFGFWINMLPSFFDLIIYGGRSLSLGQGYEFISLERVLTPRYWIDPVYAIAGTPIAFKLMLFLLPIMSAAYVAVKWYLRTENADLWTKIGNIAARTISTFYGVWFVIAWIGGLLLFMRVDPAHSEIVFLGFIHQPVLNQYYTGIGPMGDSFFLANEGPFLLIQQRAMMMALDYILFFLVFLAIAMHIWKKGSVFISLKMLNPLFLVYSALAYLLGIVVAGAIYPQYIFHWPYIVFGYLLFVSAWEAVRFASFDVNDETKTRKRRKKKREEKEKYLYGILSEKNREHLPLALLVFPVLLAAGLGPLSVVMLFLMLSLGYLYIKSRKNRIRRLYISASIGILAFINGIITPSMWYIVEWNKNAATERELLASVKTVIYYRTISPDIDILILSISLFLIGIALTSMKKDMLTIAPDKKEIRKISGGTLLTLLSGMLLPVVLLVSNVIILVPVALLSVIAYLNQSAMKEKSDEEGNAEPDRRINLTMLLILLELLLLVINYTVML